MYLEEMLESQFDDLIGVAMNRLDPQTGQIDLKQACRDPKLRYQESSRVAAGLNGDVAWNMCAFGLSLRISVLD